LGILLLSLASVAVASTAYADNSWFGFDFDKYQHHHDLDCDRHCVTSAPEIDPASALSALTLLGGGLLVLRGRSKKK
jgi:hypothetical protein